MLFLFSVGFVAAFRVIVSLVFGRLDHMKSFALLLLLFERYVYLYFMDVYQTGFLTGAKMQNAEYKSLSSAAGPRVLVINSKMISRIDVIDTPHFDTTHWHSICDLTFTFKQVQKAENGIRIWLDDNQCKKAFQVFMHRLDRAVYGNAAIRFGKRVRVIPVLEKEEFGRWNIHAAIELPRHTDAFRFDQLIRKSWSKVDWAYNRIWARDDANKGWLNYMLKPRQKSGLETWSDCIVWECLHNPIADA